MATGNVVIVGGTQGLGRELAQSYADDGRDVVVTGRDQARAETAAQEIGGPTSGIGFDLWRSRKRSPSASPTWATWTTSCSRRSSATRTPCASTTSQPRCGWSRSSSWATRR